MTMPYNDFTAAGMHYTDNTDTVTVTEDVLDLDDPCWKEINDEKCFEEDKK